MITSISVSNVKGKKFSFNQVDSVRICPPFNEGHVKLIRIWVSFRLQKVLISEVFLKFTKVSVYGIESGVRIL